uniref:Reverse transcriptase domain-containing protein n=1 Tax=Ornithorhynchus anatinus TaxID=9258 RepID=A0A6I8NBJ4_ORNAN
MIAFTVSHCTSRTDPAFTVRSINFAAPAKRYQWKVLPQGMVNSPTLCQWYVGKILEDNRSQYPDATLSHYMDDILLSHPSPGRLHSLTIAVVEHLRRYGLVVAPEKVQDTEAFLYLGFSLLGDRVTQRAPQIEFDRYTTLNDMQRLVGQIQWLRASLSIPSGLMEPLYDLLKGNPNLRSPREWTTAAKDTVQTILQLATRGSTDRVDPAARLEVTVFRDRGLFAAIHQGNRVLEWSYSGRTSKVLEREEVILGHFCLTLIRRVRVLAGSAPIIYLGISQGEVDALAQEDLTWATITQTAQVEERSTLLVGPLLRHAWLSRARMVQHEPVEGDNIFTDSTKDKRAAVYNQTSGALTVLSTPHESTQRNELYPINWALEKYSQPINVISDSLYAVSLVNRLETSILFDRRSEIGEQLCDLQRRLLARTSPIYVMHVWSHTDGRGPVFEGNRVVDASLYQVLAGGSFPESARKAHALFHLPSVSLRRLYSLTKAEARGIVRRCTRCLPFLPRPPGQSGVNCAAWSRMTSGRWMSPIGGATASMSPWTLTPDS